MAEFPAKAKVVIIGLGGEEPDIRGWWIGESNYRPAAIVV